ncbi:hypothetical protein M9H77_32851 [Catharanthus roseus]|uniref:Uncharacterized protein n=1 Tax=Catharanthus roseus TaxID=4058 RepID=A0ACC0A629_CATRO|nr:hypothetical protein M9H77_32851 [Catharanthus roseus]
MELKSTKASPVLADPAPIDNPRMGIRSGRLPYSQTGPSFSTSVSVITRKKPGKIDDVRSNGWLDAMQSSSPPHKKIMKDINAEFASDDGDMTYRSWMIKYPSALSSFGKIMTRARNRKIVVFLDYDGTLAPIVDDPDRAFMSADMRSAVKNVARYFPTAIISGRSRDKYHTSIFQQVILNISSGEFQLIQAFPSLGFQVHELVGLTELYYAGSHGMDIMFPVEDTMSTNHSHCIKSTDQLGKEVNLFQPASEFLPMIDEVFRTLVENTKDIKGAKVENHKFCTSVHYRNVEEKSWPLIAQRVHDILNDYPRLRLTHGRKVLEVRPVIDWDKGKALEFLLESLGLSNSRDVLPIYIGDDRTDEDAFKILRDGNRGYGILVSTIPKESNAFFSLRDPSEESKLRFVVQSAKPTLIFKPLRSFPIIRSSSGFSSSLDTGLSTELDAVTSYSEIVPDTVIFDDFERFPPTAATVSSSLLLGVCSLPDTQFRVMTPSLNLSIWIDKYAFVYRLLGNVCVLNINMCSFLCSAVDTALADPECYGLDNSDARMSCFFNKALVNVGGDLAKLVPGRVSTEVDARLAYDTHGIVGKVHDLLKLYNDIQVPPERLLFKIPSTWQGIEASRILESEGIQTHLTFVYSFCQAAAAAQAGASVIQIFVGRLRRKLRHFLSPLPPKDWARNRHGDPEVESALRRGEDPGIALVTKAYNYIHKYGYKSKLMAAAIRNKQDVFNLLGVDYIITPLKILQSLKDSVTPPDEKYSLVRKLSPQSAAAYNFSQEELLKWDQYSFSSAMGPAAVELLTAGMDGYTSQAKRVEELFGKIWPPPNV